MDEIGFYQRPFLVGTPMRDPIGNNSARNLVIIVMNK